MPHRRLILGLLGVAAYAVASHLLMLHAAERPWAVAALLGPLLAMGAALALRARSVAILALLGAAGAALGVIALRGGVGDIHRLYVMQHAGIHALLFAGFAASLRRGQTSLIGSVAERVHGPLTPAMRAYTRRVTLLWAGYFVAMAIASPWVHALCAWSTWSLLANLITPLLVLGIFVGEYLLRYRLHPEFERSTLLDALRAYSGGQAPAMREAASR